jgi:hypothetical protein
MYNFLETMSLIWFTWDVLNLRFSKVSLETGEFFGSLMVCLSATSYVELSIASSISFSMFSVNFSRLLAALN